MQIDNLRYTLLDKLISVGDIKILEKINELLGNVDLDKTVFKVTDKQRQMLMSSEQDIKQQKLISDETLNAEEDQWLNG